MVGSELTQTTPKVTFLALFYLFFEWVKKIEPNCAWTIEGAYSYGLKSTRSIRIAINKGKYILN